jgi:hypothetical protein
MPKEYQNFINNTNLSNCNQEQQEKLVTQRHTRLCINVNSYYTTEDLDSSKTYNIQDLHPLYNNNLPIYIRLCSKKNRYIGGYGGDTDSFMPSQRVRTKEYTHFFKSYQQANTK